MTKRLVLCGDALEWLRSNKENPTASFVTSLPDISEFNMTLPEWKKWFIETAVLVLASTPDEGVTIFYQSDIKLDGQWVDKGFLCQKAAETFGQRLLWHKIVCRTSPGITTFGRPAYSHMLCFSKNLQIDPGKSTADVIPEIGEKTWQRGMGVEACIIAAKFIAEQTPSKMIVSPFCGEGSMLAAANAFGLDAFGIERSPKRAEKAKQLTLSKDKKNWELLNGHIEDDR